MSAEAIAAAAPSVAKSTEETAHEARLANDSVLERQKERAKESHSKSSFVENHFGTIVFLIILGIFIYAAYKTFHFFGGGLATAGNDLQSIGAGLASDVSGITKNVDSVVTGVEKNVSNVVTGVEQNVANNVNTIQNIPNDINGVIHNSISTAQSDLQNAGKTLSNWLSAVHL